MKAAAYACNLLALASCLGGGYEWDAGKRGMSVALFGLCSFAILAAVGYAKKAWPEDHKS